MTLGMAVRHDAGFQRGEEHAEDQADGGEQAITDCP